MALVFAFGLLAHTWNDCGPGPFCYKQVSSPLPKWHSGWNGVMSVTLSQSLSMLTSRLMAIEEQTFFFFLYWENCSPWSYQKWVRWVTKGKNEVENVSWILQHSRQSTELAARRAEIHKEELNGSSCARNPPRVEEKRPKCEARGERKITKEPLSESPYSKMHFSFQANTTVTRSGFVPFPIHVMLSMSSLQRVAF